MKYFIFIILFQSVSLAKEINLKWRAIPEAKKYKIQVSKSNTFEKTIYDAVVETNSQVRDLKSGIYYLRVQAADKNNVFGKWSAPFKLVVTAPIKPVEKEVIPESVGYEPVKTEWKAPEAAPQYLVKVVKDGKEIESAHTTDPKIDFTPKTTGNYEVKVQAAFDKYYGPAVVVKKYSVKEKPVLKNMTSQKSTAFTWAPVEGVKKYKVYLYKSDSRAPAGQKTPYMVVETEDPKAALGKLPPGKYVASVMGDSTNSSPVSEYTFDVKKEKPVEFEKIDLGFHYNIKSVDYYARINEAGKTSRAKTTGGEFGFEGNMQFSNSNFGLRAEGNWGNLLIDNQLVSFNELKLSGTYKWSLLREEYNTHITPFFGLRAWTMPIVIRSGGSTNDNLQVLAPTFMGPAFGFDVSHPLSRKWAIASRIQTSIPLSHSNLTNDGLNDPLKFTMNAKAEVGLKYGWKGNYRLIAMAGIQNDNFRYNTNSGPQGQTLNGDSEAEIDSFTASLGLEVTDEGAEFSNTRSPQYEKFSEFDLSIKYALTPMSYRGVLVEAMQSGNNNGANPRPSFNGAFSGNFELETRGYFPSSKHGLRFMGAWGGYTYNNLTISYPEFLAQWAFRFDTNKESILRFNNYLGVRSWQVPIVTIDTNSSSSSEHFFSHNPQLLGLADTAEVSYLFAKSWKARFAAELSIPIVGTNRDSIVDKIRPDLMSYKFDLNIIKSFSSDLSAGVALGYRADRLQYVPLNSFNSASSTVELTAPVLGLFGTYSF